MLQRVSATRSEAIALIDQFCREQGDPLIRLAKRISALFTEGGHLLVAASSSLQPVAQLTVSQFAYRLGFERPGLPAVCLGSDMVLSARMIGEGQYDQHLVRHYRSLTSQHQLLLMMTDGHDSAALKVLRDEVLENEQPVALLSYDCGEDQLTSSDLDFCLNLACDSAPRRIELMQFVGHLLCELVEKELFDR